MCENSEDLHGINIDEIDSSFLSYQNNGSPRYPLIPASVVSEFSFRAISKAEMIRAFRRMKSRAVGSDCFTLDFLSIVFPFFC